MFDDEDADLMGPPVDPMQDNMLMNQIRKPKEEMPTELPEADLVDSSQSRVDSKQPVQQELETKQPRQTPDLLQQYKNANAAANQQRGLGVLLSGLAKFGSGAMAASNKIAPQKVDEEGFKAAGSLLDKMPKQVLAERDVARDQEMNDPNSALSKSLRNQYSSIFGKDIGEDISAAQLEKAGFGKLLTAKIAADARSDAAKQTALMRNMMMQQRQEGLDARIDSQAKSEFEKVNKDNINRLQNAQNIEALAAQIQAGAIIPSSNVLNQLTGDLSQLMLGSNRGGVTDREKASIDTLQGRMAKIKSFVSGHPNDALPPEYLDQIINETKVLKDKYAKGMLQNTDRLSAGTKIKQKVESFNNQANNYLQSLGYDPEEVRSHYPGAQKKQQEVKREPASASTSETVRIIAPDGTIRLIPSDKVDAALKAGGKLAE